MTAREMELLEQDALALRKIADNVLARIRAGKAPAPAGSRKRNKIDRVANLKASILAGNRKPAALRKQE